MNLRTTALRIAAFPLVAWLGAMGSITATAADWQSLTGNSPFGSGAGATAAAAPDQLEFRGVVQEEGVYLVNLFNPTTKTSQWIPVKGKAPGLEVKSYDANADKVEVTLGGKALTLPLKQARVTLLQAAPAPAPANADNANGDRAAEKREARGRFGQGENGAPPTFRNLPPEAQAMIEEFRRRRAERASQQDASQSQQQQPATSQTQVRRQR